MLHVPHDGRVMGDTGEHAYVDLHNNHSTHRCHRHHSSANGHRGRSEVVLIGVVNGKVLEMKFGIVVMEDEMHGTIDHRTHTDVLDCLGIAVETLPSILSRENLESPVIVRTKLVNRENDGLDDVVASSITNGAIIIDDGTE